MPQHIRALIALVVIAGVSYLIARRTIVGLGVSEPDYNRRTAAWFIVTALAFLCGDFFLFVVLSSLVVLIAARQERNATAMFIWLLFAVPMFSKEIPGLAGVRYIIELHWPRLLALLLLVPAAIHLRSRVKASGAGWLTSDYFVLAFLLIQLGLRFQNDSLTNTVRYGVYALLDTGLPYYVASRGLRTLAAQREVLTSLLVVSIVIGVLGIHEFVTSWNLFRGVKDVIGAEWSYGGILARSGLRRAYVSTGHPLAYGYVMVVALAVFAYLAPLIQKPAMRWLGWAVLGGALIASVSRGPWVGAVVAMLVFAAMWGSSGSKAFGGLVKVALGGVVVVAALLASPWSSAVIDLLPFVGSVEARNVDYRVNLLEVSIGLFLDQPWFGVAGFYQQLADNNLVIGGMIDVVNTYVGIGLANGVFALIGFVGAFVSVGYQIYRLLRTRAKANAGLLRLGSALLAAIAGTMVTIMTTSSIVVIPVVYWTLLGIGAGYVAMARREAASVQRRSESLRSTASGQASPRSRSPAS